MGHQLDSRREPMTTDPKGSLVCFLDERDSPKSLVVGGFYLSKKHLADLDNYMIAVKEGFKLAPQDTIKWNLQDKACAKASRLIEERKVNDLRKQVFSITDKIPIRVIMALVWKGKPENVEDSWRWGFIDVLQRLSLTLDRKARSSEDFDFYPKLDVVFDWFPGKKRLDFYFDVYQNAFLEGFTFEKNKLPPLKKYDACPCLLVTSSKYSHALQLADFLVGACADFFNWCYTGEREQSVKLFFSSFYNYFRRGDDAKVIGCGLILKKEAQAKVLSRLKELGLEK